MLDLVGSIAGLLLGLFFGVGKELRKNVILGELWEPPGYTVLGRLPYISPFPGAASSGVCWRAGRCGSLCSPRRSSHCWAWAGVGVYCLMTHFLACISRFSASNDIRLALTPDPGFLYLTPPLGNFENAGHKLLQILLIGQVKALEATVAQNGSAPSHEALAEESAISSPAPAPEPDLQLSGFPMKTLERYETPEKTSLWSRWAGKLGLV
jgi:hypothetical protein